MGDPTSRRRSTNRDRVDNSRRRNDMRRRSYSGFNAVDYSRRRGASIALAAGVGFAAGLAMGTLISRPGGNQYYFHQHAWYDVYGIRHYSGYYGPDGYRYASAAEIGYVPPPGAPSPDCMTNCHQTRNMLIGFGSLCCCCCLMAAFLFWSRSKKKGYSEYADDNVAQPSYQNAIRDPVTRQGQAIPRADAVVFIQAVEAEYVDGVEGAVGQVFDSRGFLPEVVECLACEEDAIRDSEDRQQSVFELANRWGMRDSLNHS